MNLGKIVEGKKYTKNKDTELKLEVFIIAQKFNYTNRKKYLQTDKKTFNYNMFTAYTTDLKTCYKKYKELNKENTYIFKVKLEGKYVKTDDFTKEAELSHKLNLL